MGRLVSLCCSGLTALAVVVQDSAMQQLGVAQQERQQLFRRMQYYPSAAAAYAPHQRLKDLSISDQTGVA
eukprot:807338-Pleurochrysis_carterae.AAC.2